MGCTCCHCGKKIKGSGYVVGSKLSWKKNQTIHEECADVINKRQKKVERLALKSFYNDPDAIKMLERKIKVNKKNSKVIAKIRRALYSMSPVMAKWQAKQPKIDIEALKAIPIGELMPDPPKRKYGQKEIFCCPLHAGDNTPSFQWDKKNNRWYCFGCNQFGSSIDLFMKLNNCDFKTAIRAMK